MSKKGPAPSMPDAHEMEIEQFKVKRLIKRLDAARGNGTSMISLVIPHKDDINRHRKILDEEQGTATNIKSRVNRLSVLSAITSTQQRLKMYSRTPPNGLIIYCGEILTEEGKEKKVCFDIEPFKPINTTLYMCDNRFHTECMHELLENDEKYGFIVMGRFKNFLQNFGDESQFWRFWWFWYRLQNFEKILWRVCAHIGTNFGKFWPSNFGEIAKLW